MAYVQSRYNSMNYKTKISSLDPLSSLDFQTPSSSAPPTSAPIRTFDKGGNYNNRDSSYYFTGADGERSDLSPYAFGVILVCSSLLFVFMLCLAIFFELREQQTRDNNNNDTNNGSNTSSIVAGNDNNNSLLLSLQDRIELYNRAFDSNRNQLKIKWKHIVTKTSIMEDDTTSKDTKGDEENTTTSEIFIDIELGDNNNGDKGDDSDDNDNDNDDDPLAICVPVESDCHLNLRSNDDTMSSSSLHLVDHNETKMSNGTCIICFEEYVKDDVIVWSEDPLCTHIYHKECMVNYLASNAQRKQNSSSIFSLFDDNTTTTGDKNDNNPCPTCRRPNYCTICVSGKQFLHILRSKSAPALTATTLSIITGMITSSSAETILSPTTANETSDTHTNTNTNTNIDSDSESNSDSIIATSNVTTTTILTSTDNNDEIAFGAAADQVSVAMDADTDIDLSEGLYLFD